MALLVVLLLALAPLPTTAQGQPATPDPAAAPIGVLAQFPIAALPTPHAEVWFLRMALAPGGLLPAEKQIGPVAAYVESGVLTLVSDQPVLVSPGGTGTPVAAAATPTAGGFVVALRPGESALISDGATLMVRNDAAAPTTFLVVVAYAAEREGEAGQGAEPVGLTQQGVSIAAAEFPAGPGRLAIERVEVKPGEMAASDTGHGMGIGGLELGAIEQGRPKRPSRLARAGAGRESSTGRRIGSRSTLARPWRWRPATATQCSMAR